MSHQPKINPEDRLSPELAILKPIIPQILKLVRNGLGKTSGVREKPDATAFTETDQVLEKLITSAIKTHFPPDTILGEELSANENRSQNRLWTLDPLCGSYNFAAGLPYRRHKRIPL